MTDKVTFIAKYCTDPVIHKPETNPNKKKVIEHFMNYIKEKCTMKNTRVHYYMPAEFKEMISEDYFWGYILNFLNDEMKFKAYCPGIGRMEEYCNRDFECFNFYYMIHETKYGGDDISEYVCDECSKITKVIFNIYNPDGTP